MTPGAEKCARVDLGSGFGRINFAARKSNRPQACSMLHTRQHLTSPMKGWTRGSAEHVARGRTQHDLASGIKPGIRVTGVPSAVPWPIRCVRWPHRCGGSAQLKLRAAVSVVGPPHTSLGRAPDSQAAQLRSGRSSNATAKLKTVQFAPMPTASERTDTGLPTSIRQPYFGLKKERGPKAPLSHLRRYSKRRPYRAPARFWRRAA